MRFLPALLLAALLAVLAGCATSPSSTKARHGRHPGPGHKMTVRTTAYTAAEPGGSRNAIGGRLRFGGKVQSAASDWSWLPLGTRFRIPSTGKTYVIEDYGSALVGRQTIDIYMPNMRQVRKWGVKHLEIEIQEWGSMAMSLKMLEPRQRNKHVRQMVLAMRGQ